MKRLIVLALFCCGNAINEMMQLTFSPIFSSTQAVFSISSGYVTLLPTLFLIAFAPAALGLSLLRTRWGLRSCLLAGSSVQALGACLRFTACTIPAHPLGFPLLAAGQLLAALAQPVYTNLPAVLSTTWFDSSNRALATVAATMANPIGNALGSVVPGLAVPEVPSGASPAAAASALAKLTMAQALVAMLVCAATWALVEDMPAVPPSAAAALHRGRLHRHAKGSPTDSQAALLLASAPAAEEDVTDTPPSALLAPTLPPTSNSPWAVLKRDYGDLLCSNGNFLKLLGGFGVGLGAFNALLALLGQLLAPCGYAPSVAGLAGGAMLATGLLSALGAGVALKATGAFVTALRLGIGCASVGMVGFLAALRPGNAPALLAASAILGIAAVPLLPLTLENAAEATFPTPEDASASLLTSAGKVMGVVFVAALQPLVASSTCSTVFTPAAGVVVGAMAVAAMGLLSFQVDYRRTASERSTSTSTSSTFTAGGGGEGEGKDSEEGGNIGNF